VGSKICPNTKILHNKLLVGLICFDHLESNRYRKKASVPTYIVKPDCGSQGEGIYLVNDPRDVQDAIGSKPAVVQVTIVNDLVYC